MNPDFFKGTAIEKDVNKDVANGSSSAKLDRAS
jgi:hypothetical protein